jgi:hypothetical protein
MLGGIDDPAPGEFDGPGDRELVPRARVPADPRFEWSAVGAGGVPIYVSGGSSKTRGVREADLEGKGAQFATPSELVELTFAADRVLCY